MFTSNSAPIIFGLTLVTGLFVTPEAKANPISSNSSISPSIGFAENGVKKQSEVDEFLSQDLGGEYIAQPLTSVYQLRDVKPTDWSFQALESLITRYDRHGLEMARYELIEVLINFASHHCYKTKVVFDSHYQQTPSQEEEHTQLLSVCYTAFSETADTYIERACANNSRHSYTLPARIIVVTSDQAQRHTVVGYGAEWMSSLKLQSEVATASRKSKDNSKTRQSNRGRHLLNSLDPTVQQRLKQLRLGL